MARGQLITDQEREIIRVGVRMGLNAPEIARCLGRTKQAVYKQIYAMKKGGTINAEPFIFMETAIQNELRRLLEGHEK
jgi:dUTPase